MTKFVQVLLTCLLGMGLVVTLVWVIQVDASVLTCENAKVSMEVKDWRYARLASQVSVTLTPGTAATLIYTDAQGSPTWVDFPANAVIETTTITLIPELFTSPRPDFMFGGHAFNLVGSRGSDLILDLSFDVPVTVTMHYSDTDVQNVSNESLFKLYWWSGWNWRDAARTCTPESESTYDVTNNVIRVEICEPGQYGFFATYATYLPLVFRTMP